MTRINSICVYCGSSDRGPPAHRDAAAQLGRLIAEAGIALVFGGGQIGLMGVVSQAALAAGGRVTGIIPQHLMNVERPDTHLSEMIVVDSMHARKEMMVRRSDAFVILPGGLGTLDETFEILTWKQLRLHDKPIVLCDLGGYWGRFTGLVDWMVDQGYAPGESREYFTVVPDVAAVLPALARARAPQVADQPSRL